MRAPQLLKFICVLVFAFALNQAQAQTDNLMIVKYVDWNSGSGVGVVIWNPTPNVVNLSNYELRIYGNGSNTATTTSPLLGTLQPCGTILVGNDEYINTNCRNTASTANFTSFGPGVNGNDIVVLAQTNGQIVDAIGRIGYDAGNNNSQKVANVNDALFQHTLERTPGNTARYSLTSGQYNPGVTNAANIWPNNKTTNVTGWIVSNASCITNNWASATATADAGPDITLACKTTAPITLAGATATGNGVTVQWSGGKGTFSNPNSLITTYTPSPLDHTGIKLTLRATSGCRQVTDSRMIFNGDSTQTALGLTFTPQNPMIGDTVTFTLQTANPNTVILGEFDYGDGTAAEIKRMVAKHVYRSAGTFDVEVTTASSAGCPLNTLTARVTVAEKPAPVEVKIPNIITPNNDKLNDTFKPQLPPTTTYELKIYNRWGVLIFESNSADKTWDGKNVSAGVYFAHLKTVFVSGEKLDKKFPVTVIK
ncbi:gliding motility-associated C-terminal domain-containing protein [Adhaeribacter sp. BT258]|uniref:Gliding motility-associated C-terminal domain-containing protein n=1 Tax=Adhaeribacter terrigena TaxID=2793070 RepID=A0ABS1C1S6_9BACT|nr:gliding motility-associated C-terminal domain-containing protein [Adhaeribacter terrigena]MBK0403348.1 gliding motility-associated C-terminal domain-containing protein [Adhaeribacter terrigena]